MLRVYSPHGYGQLSEQNVMEISSELTEESAKLIRLVSRHFKDLGSTPFAKIDII